MSEVRPTPSAASPAAPSVKGAGGAGAPAPVQPSAPSTPLGQGHTDPAVSLSDNLAKLAVGQKLTGVLLENGSRGGAPGDAPGGMILRTAIGNFQISGAANLAANARLSLQILSLAPVLKVAILNRDGIPLDPAPEATLRPAQEGNAPPTAYGPAGKLGGGQPQAGQPPAAQGQPPQTPQPQTTGGAGRTSPAPDVNASPAQARLQGQTQAPLSPQPSPYPPGQGADLRLSAAPPLLSAAPTHPALIRVAATLADNSMATGITRPAGTVLIVQMLGLGDEGGAAEPASLPQQAPARGAPLGNGGILTGEVIGHSGGRVQIRTSAGLLQMPAARPLAPGEQVTLLVVDERPPLQPAPHGPLPPASGDPLVDLEREWPALREGLDTLRTVDPSSARLLMFGKLPQADARLANGVLLFLAALRGGDIRNWLGDTSLEILDRAGRGDIVARLEDDFGALSRLAGEPSSSGDWRALFFPLFDGRHLQHVNLYFRHRGQKNRDGDGGEEGTRFVVDLELTSTGQMQLDGLLHEKAFHLFIRTRQELARHMRAEIARIFEDNLAITGLTGDLVFQITDSFPISPRNEMEAGHHSTFLA